MSDILETLSNLEVFILTVIGEARGEPIEGQVAVANTIKNRLHTGKYKGYKDVCLERLQFSCWNMNDPNRAYLLELGDKMIRGEQPSDIHLKQCAYITIGIDNGSITDNIHGSLYYMTKQLFDTKRPTWAKNPQNLVQKGNQVFFNI